MAAKNLARLIALALIPGCASESTPARNYLFAWQAVPTATAYRLYLDGHRATETPGTNCLATARPGQLARVTAVRGASESAPSVPVLIH